MIRLLSRHHPAANPSPPVPLCLAAGQRGRGGEGLAEAQLPHIFQDGVSPFAPGLADDETRRLSIAAPSHATPCPAAHKADLGRRGRPNAQASVGFVPGANARSAHQSRGLASLVRVTWYFTARRMAALVVLAAQRR